MSQAQLRPRYVFEMDESSESIRSKVLYCLQDSVANPKNLTEHSVANHMIIAINKKDQHYWSPTIDMNLEELKSGMCVLRIVIGPSAPVWTMFMFGYAVSILIAGLGSVLAYSQFILDKSTWAFWLIIAGFLIALLFYFIGMAGRYKAQEQMTVLKEFLEKALGKQVFNS